MPILSFAQNLEDVILHRALGHVDAGFFIDVGAGDPDRENVSRAFKDLGWRGINVEPVPDVFEHLNASRPDDININAGVAEVAGAKDFFVVDDYRLSTFVESVAQKHRREGRAVKAVKVPFYTLKELCEKHVNGPIHFLKVDVEGAEREVLAGADFEKYRPWVIVLEATLPLSPDEAYQAWEQILFDAKYKFVYTDRLNRFYVAEEKYSELSEHFIYPPNVYDQYTLAELVIRRYEMDRLQETARNLNTAQESAQLERDVFQQELFQTERHNQWLSSERQRLVDEQARERRTHGEHIETWRNEQRRLEGANHEAQAEIRRLDAELRRLEQVAQQAVANTPHAVAAATHAVREQFFRSRSWRITRPLRALGRLSSGRKG
jgi:FkbM family methyltransferase